MLFVLGLAVVFLRPRSLTALAFAAFAIGISLAGFTTVELLPPFVWLVAYVLGAVGLWSLFVFFPRRLARSDLRDALIALAGALAFALSLHLGQRASIGQTIDAGPIISAAVDVLAYTVGAGIVGVALILPLRARRLLADELGAARSMALLATGFVFFSAGTFVEIARIARGELPPALLFHDVGYVLAPALLWLRAIGGPHPRVARNVVLANAIIYPLSLAVDPNTAWAIGRTLGSLLLAYAVLRGQIEGLDLKVRFAISKSTIAALFIAVFFIASEGAQQFFGERFGGPYIGILAAGGLVFALAPLSRLADRLAAKAVPMTTAPDESHAAFSDELGVRVYRRAVRAAIDDGVLTAEEEEHLAHIAHDLGLTHPEALRIRRQIESERKGPHRGRANAGERA